MPGANPEGSLSEFCYKEEQRPAGWRGRVGRRRLRIGRTRGGAGPWKIPLGRRGWGSLSMWPGGSRKQGHRPQRIRGLGREQGSLGAAPWSLPLQVQPPRSLLRVPSAPTCLPQPRPAMGDPGPSWPGQLCWTREECAWRVGPNPGRLEPYAQDLGC